MIITNATLEAIRVGFKREFDTHYAQMMASTFHQQVATTVPSTNLTETYGWLGDFPDLIEWVGERVVKDMQESAYQITNKTWEATVGVLRDRIEDDQLGFYTPMVRSMAASAARKPDQLIAGLMKAGTTTLCYDGQNFFDTDHPVYANHDGTGAASTVSNYDAGDGSPGWFLMDTTMPLRPFIHQQRRAPAFTTKTSQQNSDYVFTNNRFLYGADCRMNVGFGFWQTCYFSKAPLTSDNLDVAIQAMMEFEGDGGRPLGVMPNLLVVGPANRAAANRVVKAMLGDGGASNPNYEAVDVVVTPWLHGA